MLLRTGIERECDEAVCVRHDAPPTRDAHAARLSAEGSLRSPHGLAVVRFVAHHRGMRPRPASRPSSAPWVALLPIVAVAAFALGRGTCQHHAPPALASSTSASSEAVVVEPVADRPVAEPAPATALATVDPVPEQPARIPPEGPVVVLDPATFGGRAWDMRPTEWLREDGARITDLERMSLERVRSQALGSFAPYQFLTPDRVPLTIVIRDTWLQDVDGGRLVLLQATVENAGAGTVGVDLSQIVSAFGVGEGAPEMATGHAWVVEGLPERARPAPKSSSLAGGGRLTARWAWTVVPACSATGVMFHNGEGPAWPVFVVRHPSR